MTYIFCGVYTKYVALIFNGCKFFFLEHAGSLDKQATGIFSKTRKFGLSTELII